MTIENARHRNRAGPRCHPAFLRPDNEALPYIRHPALDAGSRRAVDPHAPTDNSGSRISAALVRDDTGGSALKNPPLIRHGAKVVPEFFEKKP